jgi:hypothetical protein
MFWVPSESDKQALVQDQNSPFFTTPRFDGHPSVLVRASRISELTLQELTEIVHDAWLTRASPTGRQPGSAHAAADDRPIGSPAITGTGGRGTLCSVRAAMRLHFKSR